MMADSLLFIFVLLFTYFPDRSCSLFGDHYHRPCWMGSIFTGLLTAMLFLLRDLLVGFNLWYAVQLQDIRIYRSQIQYNGFCALNFPLLFIRIMPNLTSVDWIIQRVSRLQELSCILMVAWWGILTPYPDGICIFREIRITTDEREDRSCLFVAILFV